MVVETWPAKFKGGDRFTIGIHHLDYYGCHIQQLAMLMGTHLAHSRKLFQPVDINKSSNSE